MSNQLADAAQAVIERWDCPLWDWEMEGPTADLIHALRQALAAHEAAKPESDRVPMPQNADQAVGMVSLGIAWLKEHAPERLKPAPAPEAAKPAEPVYYEFRPVSGDGEWRRVEPRDRVYGVGDALADIRSYRYEGKPCYEVRALYAAPVAVASPWMPIETAPKDGEVLLLKEKWEDEPFIGQWVSSAYGGKWAASRTHYDTDGNACVIDHVYSEGVSHWMPLPPAPKEKP